MKNFLKPVNSAIFDGIDKNSISSLLCCLQAETKKYGKGEYILNAGGYTESVGLIASGSALVIQEDFWGNRNIISRITTGQLFGEAFACSDEALNVSVISEEPCSVLWLSVTRMLTSCPASCEHHSRMIRNLISSLAQNNLRLNEKLTHMGRRSTRDKLLSYLSAEARRTGCHEFDIPFDRQQLADYLCVERSAMSNELSKLKKAGVLTFYKHHFILNTEY